MENATVYTRHIFDIDLIYRLSKTSKNLLAVRGCQNGTANLVATLLFYRFITVEILGVGALIGYVHR